MRIPAEKIRQQSGVRPAADSTRTTALHTVDSPNAVAQRRLLQLMDNSPHMQQFKAMEQLANNSAMVLQQKKGINVNDDPGLEKEADEMGERALQMKRVAGNGAVVQRSLVAGSGRVNKGPRHNFLTELTNALGLSSGQARCHLIPFGTLRQTVMYQINEALAGNKDANSVKTDLGDLLRAVFPNGGTADNHKTNTNYSTLNNLAGVLFGQAQQQILNLEAELAGQKNISNLVTYGTNLIDALNNSPDNLRPGHGSTNSSIQDNLDIPVQNVSKQTLPPNTNIVDDSYQFSHKLTAPVDVLVPDNNTAAIILDLLDSFTVGQSVSAYSSGAELQSSDVSGMKTATMTNSNPTPIAIELSTGWYLFQTS